MLLTLLNTCTSLFLLNDYFKRNYPEKYNYCVKYYILKNIFKMIRVFSYGQMFFYKTYKRIKQNENVHKMLDYFYKSKSKPIENEQNIQHIMIKGNEEFYIYSDFTKLDDDNKCVNKKISNLYPETLNYELSRIEFISVTLKVDDNLYKIDFKTDIYNFYIVDNILDKKFFVYYLMTYYNLNSEGIASSKMYLKLIDNNVNEIEIDINKEFIQILKDNFLIVVS